MNRNTPSPRGGGVQFLLILKFVSKKILPWYFPFFWLYNHNFIMCADASHTLYGAHCNPPPSPLVALLLYESVWCGEGEIENVLRINMALIPISRFAFTTVLNIALDSMEHGLIFIVIKGTVGVISNDPWFKKRTFLIHNGTVKHLELITIRKISLFSYLERCQFFTMFFFVSA